MFLFVNNLRMYHIKFPPMDCVIYEGLDGGSGIHYSLKN